MKQRYYSTLRPLGPGTYPKKDGRETITNYDAPTYCEEIGKEAWGHIECSEPLTEQEAREYELTPAGTKTYWCVTTSINDRGRVVSHITNTVEASGKPENISKSTTRRDIYNDWFESFEEAQAFAEEAKRA